VSEDRLRAAVAAGVLASEEAHVALLRSIVDVARAIFGARASSIFLLDEETDELVFEALSGEGSERLVGKRFPSSTGIAGWVLVTRQPLVLEDVSQDPRFARDAAEATGYVPQALMAVPLLHGERALGVLEVLDRTAQARTSFEEMDLLSLFAAQAAIALDLLQSGRRARAVLAGGDEDVGVVARLSGALDALEGERREAGLRLLAALEDVLGDEESRAARGPPGSSPLSL
jgi:GAF domain-containing protein